MTYHGVFVIQIKNIIFVAKVHNCRIFSRKFMITHSLFFLGSAGFINSAASVPPWLMHSVLSLDSLRSTAVLNLSLHLLQYFSYDHQICHLCWSYLSSKKDVGKFKVKERTTILCHKFRRNRNLFSQCL